MVCKDLKVMKVLMLFIISLITISGCDLATWQAMADEIDANSKNKITTENSKFILNVIDIVEFDWISGNQDWKDVSKSRLYKSKFILYEDKRFEAVLYHDENYNNIVYGKFWYRSDGIIDFEASTNTSTGTGSGTNITISGAYFKNNIITLSFKSSAVYQATINSTYYGNSVAKAFTAKLKVSDL